MTVAEIIEKLQGYLENHPCTYAGITTEDDLNNLTIEGVSLDSRIVKPGFVFGLFETDAALINKYVDDAMDKDAVAIIAHPSAKQAYQGSHKPVWLLHPSPRQFFAKFTARVVGTQPLNCVAVTGTNGKTSVVSFTRQLWESIGIKAASIGTLGIQTPIFDTPLPLTTPDTVTLQYALRDLKRQGIEHVAMEASSHALAQSRMDGVRLRAAVFTNLTQDHLDYHETMEDYFHSKKRLFENILGSDGAAILNADIPQYDDLVDTCVQRNQRVFSYGFQGGFVRILSLTPITGGIRVHFKANEREHKVLVPLVAEFQVYNLLAAVTMLLALGADINGLVKGMENIKPVPGRMELVAIHSNNSAIYVDYAHTPAALEAVLKSLRFSTLPMGKIRLVFGCGGNRDKAKRQLMGEIAAEYADVIYLTDDNPRHEDPAAIRAAVLAGCPQAIEIADRRQAIERAIMDLEENDILLIAGKGHESGQIVGDTILPFDDARIVKELLYSIQKACA